MKKILALLLALSMALGLAACSGQDGKESDNSGDSDLAYIQEKGTLVVGITEFEPMDYTDADGNWIGFDADMARAFAESLGVEAQFQVIADWDSKVMELEGKTVAPTPISATDRWSSYLLTRPATIRPRRAWLTCSLPWKTALPDRRNWTGWAIPTPLSRTRLPH